MLELLARAAGAGFVAPDLAPGGRIIRIALLRRYKTRGACRATTGTGRAEARSRARGGIELVLAGIGIAMLGMHFRQFGLRRLLEDHLDAHHLGGDLLTQARDQPLEELEGFEGLITRLREQVTA